MTTEVVRRQQRPAPVRRMVAKGNAGDHWTTVGAGVAAICVAALLFRVMFPASGPVAFLVVSFALFLGFVSLLTAADQGRSALYDRLAGVVVHTMALLLGGALVTIVAYTLARGMSALTHLNFYVQDLSTAGPLQPLTVGGISHAIIGTLEQITIALAITIPIGLTSAVFLNEMPGRYSRFVRTIVEAMTALPSIVAGLFIYATAILALGLGKCGLAAALAISVMMLPIIIRAADVVIRLVPGSLREASLALGASQWRTVWSVVLPEARPGLTTAIILGTARGIGETSPVLLTAGYTAATNHNPLSGPQVSLPLAAFSLVKSPSAAMAARGFGAAATLLLLVLALFVVARALGGRRPGAVSRRRSKRLTAGSAKDLARLETRAAPLKPEGWLQVSRSEERDQR